MLKKHLSVLLIPLFLSSNGWASQLFSHEHCVQWVAKKTSFLIFSGDAQGTNCEIKVRFHPVSEYHKITVDIPLAGFDSGDPSRDQDVRDYLAPNQEPTIVVATIPTPLALWEQIFQLGRGILAVELNVAGVASKIDLPVEIHKEDGQISSIRGQWVGRFTDLAIEPPSVLWGLVTSVEDYLELSFNFQAQKIQSLNLSASVDSAKKKEAK